MHPLLLKLIAGTALLAALGACALPVDPAPKTPPMNTPAPPAAAAPTDPQLAALVATARADAAQRARLPAAQVVLVSAEPVTWSDGSMGCPQPGMMYTQALVPGFRIQLRAAGRDWLYHASQRGQPFLCEGQAQPGLPGNARY